LAYGLEVERHVKYDALKIDDAEDRHVGEPGLEVAAADIGHYPKSRYSLALVYGNNEGDREKELRAVIHCGAYEEFVYGAEDKDYATTALVAFEIRRAGVIVEFINEDNILRLFAKINAFKLCNIVDPI